ncbi:MAG: phosphoribosyltransferase regulatory subunit [Myxococcaceae bacterium]|nr:phosphoribosyltransferase regulatory subunit [Myxococcaceae bacterium]
MDRVLPRSLEHPLPAGMRDLLPEEAASRRALSRTVLDRFALYGYRLVTPPAFELAHVVERGLGSEAASDMLRFIEPESGDVAVLRPDMTPQIARIVATRMRDHAPPHRLAYEGTVVRRRSGRAKKHRQIPQVGVELCGVADDSGDLELLELAADSLRAAGLAKFTIDVADAGIVRELLSDVSNSAPDRAEDITMALAKKDEAMLAELVRGLPCAAALLALPRLSGGREALEETIKVLSVNLRARTAAERLLKLFDRAAARGLAPFLTADAGEVRGFAYYTGTTFSIYADGPGEPIGGGGRYDELLGRFGAPMAAVGFGLDLDTLAWALRSAGAAKLPLDGVVYVGDGEDGRVAALRARGVPTVAIAYHDAALAHARSWGFALVWNGATVFDVRTEAARSIDVPPSAPGKPVAPADADRVAGLVARMLSHG